MSVTTIEPSTGIATLINVFTVSPQRQRELVSLLDDATEQVMRHVPGFISANIHASLDGRRVVNYAQWESVEHFQAMLADPTAREHMDACAAVAENIDPLVYTVESSHHA